MKGYTDARRILKEIKPDVVFSKGGFVSVPVVRAAASLKIPCIIHESDLTPGLANKLCIPVAKKVCCNFPETVANLPKGKAVLTGTPIRAELFSGDREKGLTLCGFTSSSEKPLLMIMGGSQGAASVNDAVRRHLEELLQDFRIVHLCGSGKYDSSKDGIEGYKQFEYVKDELRHLFAAADLIISRAGANAIFEILALQKPNLLIPLSIGTRGDQILNARSFESQGFSQVLVESEEEGILDKKLVSTVLDLYRSRDKYIEAMAGAGQQGSIPTIMGLLNDLADK
jgi:UDP-N-acetylglucosamine--N-acetylmuramyl-(pentapeptide) pyrophosphoryl-undecaprenol N-acetylglucosamine transferase